MMRPRWDAGLALGVAAAVMAIFTAQIAGPSVPVLRHDWNWPSERAQFVAFFTAYVSGWRVGGVGTPNPYPNGYLLASFQSALGLLFGAAWALRIYLALIAAFALFCAQRTVELLAASDRNAPFSYPRTSAAIAAGLLLLNPWTYTQAVAGHITMILAYCALFAIVVEILWGGAPQRRISALAVLVFPQIQFALLALLIAVGLALRGKARPLLTLLLVALPSIAGIFLNHTYLQGIPYTLQWQRSQSVAPAEGAVLLGYFTHYDAMFHALPVVLLLWTLLATAAYGWASERAHRLGALLAFLGVWLWTSGTKGMFAPLYTAIVLHVHATAVFRELYDLVGCLAMLIVAGSLLAMRRAPALVAASALSLLALGVVWTIAAPASFAVDAAALPPLRIDAPAGTRYALYPAFQPMSYEGKGSGNDPDVVPTSDGATPLNDYSISYPEAAALAAPGDWGARQLGALGVSRVISRAGYKTDEGSLRDQIGTWKRERRFAEGSSSAIPFTPILQEIEPAPPCLIGQDLSRACIALIDTAQAARVTVAQPISADSVDPQQGWTSTATLPVVAPMLAQGVGGTFTRSRAPYPTQGHAALLAAAYGRLRGDDGRLLTASSAYRWISLPASVHAVVCEGTCAIVYLADAPVELPANAGARAIATPTAHAFLPWLIAVRVAARRAETLRYAVRYSPSWLAFAGNRLLPHARLNAYANGWSIPAGFHGAVILLQSTAAIQAAAELIGLSAVLHLLVPPRTRQRTPRPKSSSPS